MRKKALVTGGSRGIGKVLVKQLIDEGYFVHFTFLNSLDEKVFNDEYSKYCEGRRVDGRNPLEVQDYINEISTDDSPITVLINNAGITRDNLIKDSCYEDLKETLDTNLGGCYNYSHAVLPYMIREKQGDIINISSLATQNIRNGNAFYGASKSAINRFSETLALEVARFNIAVNVVSPGFIETDLIKSQLDPKKRRELLKQIPLKKFTKAEEVAQIVAFLLKRQPTLIGTIIPVGGGGHLL